MVLKNIWILLLSYIIYLVTYTESQPTYEQVTCGRDDFRVANMEKLLQNLVMELNDQKQQLQHVQNELASLKRSHVAFSARMNMSTYAPTTNEPVPFNMVYVNTGGHYDTNNYKFKCPTTGMYFFVFNFHSDYLRGGTHYFHTSAVLKLDGENVIAVHCRNGVTSEDVEFQCGTSSVVNCSKGQHVWVGVIWANGNKMIGIDSTHKFFSSFSGFLLFESA